MKYIKTYEKKLSEVSFTFKDVHKNTYKYDIDDFVIFKELNRIFKINMLNKNSNTQDYYLINPLDKQDRGWVLEEELSEPTIEQLKEIETKLTANKYNL